MTRALQLRWSDLGHVLWRPFAAAAVMALGVLALNFAAGFQGPVRLFCDTSFGALIFATTLIALWLAVGKPPGLELAFWTRLSKRRREFRRYLGSRVAARLGRNTTIGMG